MDVGLPAGAAAALLAALAPALELREAAADASLFLLVGGLVMLTLIVVLVLMQNLVPERAGDTRTGGQQPTPRQLRTFDGGPLAHTHRTASEKRGGKRRLRALAPVDQCLDRVVELRLGEPRLLQSQERLSRIRLYACRGCAFALPSAGGAGCMQERAALEEVFGAVYGSAVRAQESTCRRRGDATCEFEVAH